MLLNELIKTRRQDAGLTIRDVGEAVGVNPATVSRWESGEISNMRRDKIEKLSIILGIPVEILLGRDPNSETTRCKRIPVLGRVAAGVPTEAIENIVDYVEIPEAWHGDYFALKVRGTSMSPRIVEDDILIVHRQQEAESGDIVIAQVNGDDATVKKLLITPAGITLQPFNAEFAPLFFDTDQQANLPVKILGRVVECRHRF